MLPEELHRLEGQEQGVQGAAAGLRLQGGVGLLSVEGDGEFGHGHGLDVHSGGGGAVHHQGHVDVLETALLQHPQLAVGGLFRGGAVHHNGEGAVAGTVLQRLGSSHNGGTLHVVAAGVAKALQSVVLTQKADAGTALAVAELGPEGGFHPAGAGLHLEAVLGQVVSQLFLGVKLLKAQLGVVKNTVRHSGQRGTLCLHSLKQVLFQGNSSL